MIDTDENLDTGGGRFAHLSPSERRYLWRDGRRRRRGPHWPSTAIVALTVLTSLALMVALAVAL